MFSKQKLPNGGLPVSSSSSNNGDIPSIIASDLKIVGNLISGGFIEIEGEIEGNVTCGQVTIRRTGSVKGDVTANVIQVDGEINGLVKGKDIVLAESGRVTGVIMYESLSVKDGAYIDGQCKSADKLHRGDVEALENQRSADRVLMNERAEEKEEAFA
ncbi:MAG: hypothetical protein K0R98_1686 [Rickettsiaceae bacterium]|jgi:cytoskeletal protein CcmA (bactofilin family)|nr:hypothetical protein [Rickettsiaceae bacterium]